MRLWPSRGVWQSFAGSALWTLAVAVYSPFIAFASFLGARVNHSPLLYVLSLTATTATLLAVYAWLWEWRQGKAVMVTAASVKIATERQRIALELADLRFPRTSTLKDIATGTRRTWPAGDWDILALVNAGLIESMGPSVEMGEYVFRLVPAHEAAIRKHLAV